MSVLTGGRYGLAHSLCICRRSPTFVHKQPTSRLACSAARSLYDLLGVQREAATRDIRLAYRSKAALLHPHTDQESKLDELKALNLAYEILSSAQLRHRYDCQGIEAMGAQYSFLLGYLGTTGERSLQGARGEDVYTVLGLQQGEAVTGAKRMVTITAMGQCRECKGTGLKGGAVHLASEACSVCRGLGEILRSKWSPQGRLTLVDNCPACGGRGVTAVEYCTRCSGKGTAPMKRTVSVTVPAGLDSTSVLRVPDQGDCGTNGGPPGDLYIQIKVYSDDTNIRRQGCDLFSDLAVGVLDAALGATVEVRTYRGERLLDIPAGTQHGEQLVVRGAGVPSSQGGIVEYGHHYFCIQLVVPSSSFLTPQALPLLHRLKQASNH